MHAGEKLSGKFLEKEKAGNAKSQQKKLLLKSL
jgi:hypothetical protein